MLLFLIILIFSIIGLGIYFVLGFGSIAVPICLTILAMGSLATMYIAGEIDKNNEINQKSFKSLIEILNKYLSNLKKMK